MDWTLKIAYVLENAQNSANRKLRESRERKKNVGEM